VSGENQIDAYQDTTHWRLDSKGRPIAKPFKILHDGSAPVQDSPGEGCVIYGSVIVNKVAGNMHIAVGTSTQKDNRHVHQFHVQELLSFNASHFVNRLSFGDDFKGIVNPLNGVAQINSEGAAHFQYFIKIVPTVYVDDTRGTELNSNQYSVTEHSHIVQAEAVLRNSQKIPGVFFFYDLSPFMVRVVDTRTPLSQFFTSICAIVGGVVTVAAVIDSCLFHITRMAKRAV